MTSGIEHAFLQTSSVEPDLSATNWLPRQQQRVFLRKATAYFAKDAK